MSDVAHSMGRIIVLIGSEGTALLHRLRDIEAELSEDGVRLIVADNEDEIPLFHLLEAITLGGPDELIDCESTLAPREYLNPREILDIDADMLLRDCGPPVELVPQHQLWNLHPQRPGKGQQKTTSGKRAYTKTPRMRV